MGAPPRGGPVNTASDQSGVNGGHGTAMARIIAGSGVWPEGSDKAGKVTMVGIAPEANIYPVKASDWASGYVNHFQRALEHVAGQGDVKIVNMSFGDNSTMLQTEIDGLRDLLGDLKNANKLMVVSAGNGGKFYSTPASPASFAADQGLASHMIVAGAVDGQKNLRLYSQKPGKTKNRYLVAPDLTVGGTSDGTITWTSAGTSSAAAMISGAAAVVWGRWPYLTADRVANVLLETAEDLGDPGVDDVYGRGLLRLDRAMEPQGNLVAPSMTGQSITLGQTVGTLPASAYMALQAQGLSVQYYDKYERNFAVNASAMFAKQKDVSAAQQRDGLVQEAAPRYEQTQGGMSFAWAGAAGRGEPWFKMGFAGQGWGGEVWRGAMFVPQAFADSPVVGRFAQVSGAQARLQLGGGLALQGMAAFGKSVQAQDLQAVGLGLAWQSAGWTLRLDATGANASAMGDGADRRQAWSLALEREVADNVTLGVALHQGQRQQRLSSGFGQTAEDAGSVVLRLAARDMLAAGDRLSVSFNVPQRRTTHFSLDLPTRVDMTTGASLFERVNLTSSSREPLRLGLGYAVPLKGQRLLQLGASVDSAGGRAASVVWQQRF
ncbi:MAG: S8 family serine peptidase [Rhodocyclaceae bacterium]|nr:S8 family serine peptidase [Rhodocyclaceae bacterium]